MPTKTEEEQGRYSVAFTADSEWVFAHWKVVGVVTGIWHGGTRNSHAPV